MDHRYLAFWLDESNECIFLSLAIENTTQERRASLSDLPKTTQIYASQGFKYFLFKYTLVKGFGFQIRFVDMLSCRFTVHFPIYRFLDVLSFLSHKKREATNRTPTRNIRFAMKKSFLIAYWLFACETLSALAFVPPKPKLRANFRPMVMKATNKEKKETSATISPAFAKSTEHKPTDVSMKFGGSSLASPDRINYVANLIKGQIEKGYRPRAVVCSAMGKTTNNLLTAGDFAMNGRVCVDAVRSLQLDTCKAFNYRNETLHEIEVLLDECENLLKGVKLIQELSPKSLDQLVSYGERCSVRIMAARLNQIGVPAMAFDAWDVGIQTDSNFGDASLLPSSEEAIRASFDRIDPNVVAVVTGFIGHDPQGRITTLGRGGSDLTATAIGAACKLDEIQVWKDVDGILTSDPRMVPNAKPVQAVSYEEASEMAHFGAQVLHPIAMQPAMRANVPVRVKNSYNPGAVGTIITKQDKPEQLVTSITSKKGVTLMDIHSTQRDTYTFLSTVFGNFEKHKLSVDVLASSEVSVSLTLDKKQDLKQVDDVIRDLEPYADVTLHKQRAILTLITDVERASEVLATAFRVFSTQDIKVEMMSQGASKVNISFVLREDQLEKAVLNLHKCFFEDECAVEQFVAEEDTIEKSSSTIRVTA